MGSSKHIHYFQCNETDNIHFLHFSLALRYGKRLPHSIWGQTCLEGGPVLILRFLWEKNFRWHCIAPGGAGPRKDSVVTKTWGFVLDIVIPADNSEWCLKYCGSWSYPAGAWTTPKQKPKQRIGLEKEHTNAMSSSRTASPHAETVQKLCRWWAQTFLFTAVKPKPNPEDSILPSSLSSTFSHI